MNVHDNKGSAGQSMIHEYVADASGPSGRTLMNGAEYVRKSEYIGFAVYRANALFSDVAS
jgi:hypothetical protein